MSCHSLKNAEPVVSHAVEEVTADTEVQRTEEEGSDIRRSQRIRALTEKGRSLQDARLTDLLKDFEKRYNRWKHHVNGFRRAIKNGDDQDLIGEELNAINLTQKDINRVYEEIRAIAIPESETRRRCDACHAITMVANEKALCFLNNGDPGDIPWPETRSVFESTMSNTSSIAYGEPYRPSSVKSLQKQLQEAAEAATIHDTMKTQHYCDEEMRKVEVEESRLRERRKELEELRRHNAERAYSASVKSDNEEVHSVLPLQHGSHYAGRPNARVPLFRTSAFPQSVSHTRPQIPSPQQAHPTQATMSAPLHDSSHELVRALAEAITANRIPIPEPAVFSGDPLEYNDWKLSFQTLIDGKNLKGQEKLYFLRKYVSGPAKRSIEGHFLAGTEASYHAAWKILDDRFGDPFVISKSYRDRIYSWPKIAPKDSTDLRQFVDFLTCVESATPYIQELNTLSDCFENQRLAAKLPDWLSSRWNRAATKFKEKHRSFPNFSYFVEFLNKEARIACNPITSSQAIRPTELERPLQAEQARHHRTHGTRANTHLTGSDQACVFCGSIAHSLENCSDIMEIPTEERLKFVQSKRLCFGCLKIGHNSRGCTSRSVCEKCERRHPTCLHQGTRPMQTQQKVPELRKPHWSKQVISNKVTREKSNTYTSPIIPVYVSTVAEPEREILVYALLDTQSDTTFIVRDVAETLNAEKELVTLKISTITTRTKLVSSLKLKELQVRGVRSKTRIRLPTTYTRDHIPANRAHIPTCRTAKDWPHLEHLADEMSPQLDCKVGLLIGYNCSQALLPLDVLSGEEGQPFAQKSVLGWTIVGCTQGYDDEIGVSHRIIARQVLPPVKSSCKLKNEVHFVYRNKIKEVVTPSDIVKVFESDFVERNNEEGTVSQEDLQFLAKLREGITHRRDGHYEMPLPFKEDVINLPNNKTCAEHRLRSLKRRLEGDKVYYRNYTAFMEEIVSRGETERVPEIEMDRPAWYIPHHGVYHPQKPDRIRVVFDCSAKFQKTSLNEKLLTGPDLTNTLVGVLCRFRKGQIAIMCDVERMFHQFRVASQHQDYLRFLWWEGGNMEIEPSVFRMKVHLFRAASSPGCANFGLKHLAEQGEGKYSQAALEFVQRNFYVDDGLISVDTEIEAVHLVKEAIELCNSGRLHLHKFITNSKEVIATIPEGECALGATDLDMALGEPKIERALGIQWCVASDQFHFRTQAKENPFTRRGVLSTVASIFDPLGFVAPVILLGKKILQRMCHDKISWDEPVPEDLRPHWESWLQDLHNLSSVKIPRCYTPTTHQDIKRYELHHFSDASASGYGACSYLRSITKSGDAHCTLVMGKARVAPTKVTTIPRLELTAAVVATRVGHLLKRELDFENVEEFYWTDSKVVLGYINNDTRRFHVFVANRIQQIKSSTRPDQWRYVTSENNPADHVSRGLTAREIVSSGWFTGPSFLWQRELPEEEMTVGEISDEDPEVKKVHVHATRAKEQNPLLNRLQKFSDWNRVVIAVARLKRKPVYLERPIHKTVLLLEAE